MLSLLNKIKVITYSFLGFCRQGEAYRENNFTFQNYLLWTFSNFHLIIEKSVPTTFIFLLHPHDIAFILSVSCESERPVLTQTSIKNFPHVLILFKKGSLMCIITSARCFSSVTLGGKIRGYNCSKQKPQRLKNRNRQLQVSCQSSADSKWENSSSTQQCSKISYH